MKEKYHHKDRNVRRTAYPETLMENKLKQAEARLTKLIEAVERFIGNKYHGPGSEYEALYLTVEEIRKEAK